jgi:hypothetical protein
MLARAVVDHHAHAVIDDGELVDAGAAAIAIAGVGAGAKDRCAPGVGGGQSEQARLVFADRVPDARVRVQYPHQPLGDDTEQRRCQQERFDPHVAQSRHRADRRVRVQCGQYEVAGQRRLHGDLRGLRVADLADHHHVRVLAQDRAQAACKGHLDFGVDLGLADAVDVILDRVLDRHDVAGAVVDALERGVERRGLAGTRRAGDQDDAVRLVDQVVEHALHPRLHAE